MVDSLTATQVRAIEPADLAQMSTAQIATLLARTVNVTALATTQVRALHSANIGLFRAPRSAP